MINSSRLIDLMEIEEWKNIVEDDKVKLWNYIKKIVKIRTKLKQVNQWINNNVGTILKQFKNKWYEDTVINTVVNERVHLLKKLRIGNTKLNRHCKRGLLKICNKCGDNQVESNEHYLMECKEYEQQRKVMFEIVRGPMEDLGYNITTKTLLGFFDDHFSVKKNDENDYKNMCTIINAVITFIVQTGRFN